MELSYELNISNTEAEVILAALKSHQDKPRYTLPVEEMRTTHNLITDFNNMLNNKQE